MSTQLRLFMRSLAARYALVLVVLLALALRLLLWSRPLHQLANDEVEYVTVARDLLAGRGWQFYEHYHWLRAPLYPLFLAASLALAGGDLHRAALPNIVLSVATVYLSYRLALLLVGRRAALLAALFTAILWTTATFASLYMSETLFTFLLTGGLLCLVSATDGRWTWGIAAGVLFGLATLTRSIALVFLPIAALWLLLRRPTGHTAPQRRALCSLLFVLCSVLVIAPWTIRNSLAYGRPILVETGLSYNLWAFNEPREDQDTIFRTLERIPNPAERSAYATAKGLARLREDPAILLRKLWPNWIYLWRVKPIQDRFLMESYYADVDLPLFAAALIFDDALYLLIALAGIAGLAFCGRPDRGGDETVLRDQRSTTALQVSTAASAAEQSARRAARSCQRSPIPDPRWLIVAWLLYVIATVLLTHGEARYRHLLFPALIPYAAWALVRVWGRRRWAEESAHAGADGQAESEGLAVKQATTPGASATTRWPHILPLLPQLLVLLLWALILWPALVYYPWAWAGQHTARGWHTLVGDIAWATGARAAALHAYERAIQARETPDAWLRLGDAARALGDRQRALSAYRAASALAPPYIAAGVRRGDLLRELGDLPRARQAFDVDYADPQQVVDWAWRELRPTPQARLDIGDGLDFGYVGGVYPAEVVQGATARWTNGHGALRLRGAGGGPLLLRLRLAAPRPDRSPVPAQICALERCRSLSIGPEWRVYSVPLQGVDMPALTVEIRSTTFVAPDGRQLGVLIDHAEVVTLGRN
jgi:4-amino-4-deoxy-L-arabinose transferase-like glycosyltransferase